MSSGAGAPAPQLVAQELDMPKVAAIEDTDDRFAVYRNPGPGTYRGELSLGRRGVLPVGCEVSLPPVDRAAADAAGLEFVRWAR